MKRTRSRLSLLVLFGMVAALFPLGTVAPAIATPTVIASDLTAGPSVGLLSYTPDPATPFTSAGDGFGIYQRGVSPSIPFSILDDTISTFPPDTQGIIDDNNLDPFFGITDTVNSDNSGPVSATWVFDIAGGTNLTIAMDAGAMGDFEAGSDSFDFSYSIDGAPPSTLWSFAVDESATRNYTLANGTTVVSLDDPLNAGATPLSNVLTTIVAPVAGTGSELAFTVTASTDGGSEAVAFQNIMIMSEADGGGPSVSPGDIIVTEVMQNPSMVGDSSGEWFEVHNTTASTIDLDGWTIVDADFDSHVISGTLEVAADGYAVLGNNTETGTNGGVTVDYDYGSTWFLSNGADEIILLDGSMTEIDQIKWDGGPIWPDPNGASMTLDPTKLDAVSNDDGANWCEATTPYGLGDLGTPGASNDTCGPPPGPMAVFIHEIQGDGSSVAITTEVEVQAVVTSIFTRDDVMDGFFIQEEDVQVDGDSATSEGIFVFCRGHCPTGLDPAFGIGDLITMAGTPSEFFGMSQINLTPGSLGRDDIGVPLPTPTPIDLPAPDSTMAEATFEDVEGMLVSFTDSFVVSEYFELGRYGQVILTETSRAYQYTHDNTPDVAGYATHLADLAKRQIILDDDNNDQNDPISDGPDEAYYYPSGGLSNDNKFRGGDTIDSLTGVLHWSFAGQSGTDAWRVRPTAADYSFTSANPAPTSPADVGGDIRVANFNVLNYFSTLNQGSSNCGPSANLGCRGANSDAELERQRTKLVEAISGLNAHVVGLLELQNDDDTSISDLVAGLNGTNGPTYDYIATGFIGGDAIKVGLIYQPDVVTPAGAFAIMDSSVDPAFNDTKNRPALIQTFEENATGEKFTVAVNHLKSKGSSCGDPSEAVADGQGNCADTRTAAATALADYLATDPTESGDPDFLIMGDLNSYAMEDPITALDAAGYADLISLFLGSDAYSFLFSAQLGYLDHAMANPSLLSQVTGVTEWHINADEIPLFDYNDDIRDPGEAAFERKSGVLPIYAPDPFRSSDHDPVMIGLNLANPMGNKEAVIDEIAGLLTGDRVTDMHLEKAIDRIERSLTPSYWTSDQTIASTKVFDDEKKAINELQSAVKYGHGLLPSDIEGALNILTNADRILARVAIIAALNNGGTQKEIDKAEAEMANAVADWLDGKYDKAIDHYKKAWDHANKA